jgi:predicted DNA-binding transcriptional regulator AlpA
MTDHLLITKGDLSKLLKISTRTIDRRRSAGEILEPLPRSRQPRWVQEDVEAWIRAGRPKAEVWVKSRSRRR